MRASAGSFENYISLKRLNASIVDLQTITKIFKNSSVSLCLSQTIQQSSKKIVLRKMYYLKNKLWHEFK